MYKVSIFGIPAHPIVNDLPAALFPASFICDTVSLVGGGKDWARSGYHTLLLGTVTALAAGILGAFDAPLALAQPETRLRLVVNAGLNTALLGLFGTLLWQRSGAPEHIGLGGWLTSLLGNIALNYSAWKGSSMVYHGLRVGEQQPIVPAEVYAEPAVARAA